MPKKSRAKRTPTKSRQKPKERSISTRDMADEMETPLYRAEDLIRALEFVGYGMSSLEEDSAPAIFAIAQALSENLEAVKNCWQLLFNEAAANK
jgi:hypothetical protein